MAVRIALILSMLGCAVLSFCVWKTERKLIAIPTCGARIEVPLGCAARKWGNGVEVNCRDSNKIYHCDTLSSPSPKAGK